MIPVKNQKNLFLFALIASILLSSPYAVASAFADPGHENEHEGYKEGVNHVWTGDGPPNSKLGKKNDLYIDNATPNHKSYEKTGKYDWTFKGEYIGGSGATGPVGPAGANGAVGPVGPAGANGAVGPIGPTGLTGAQGPQGDIGPIGLTGPAGALGPMGPAGALGPIGLTGPQGAAGTPGLADKGNTEIIRFGIETTLLFLSNPNTRFITDNGYGVSSIGQSNMIGVNGTIEHFIIDANQLLPDTYIPGVNRQLVITLQKNDLDTAISCTIMQLQSVICTSDVKINVVETDSLRVKLVSQAIGNNLDNNNFNFKGFALIRELN